MDLEVIRQILPPWFFYSAVFLFGAIVGSFLNVCIHRMPRGHSLIRPGSHCYACEKPIPWHHNIPLLSFLILRGKCHSCGAPFSIRYWLVELFTGALLVLVWWQFPIPEAICYSVFTCGLIVASFIDFEHLIIPDEITWGGVLVGVICSGIVPALQDVESRFTAALWSLGGAATGFFVLWAVVELGKYFLGVKKAELSKPTEIRMDEEGILMEGERDRWEDVFTRDSDVLWFQGTNVRLGEKSWEEEVRVEVRLDGIKIGGEIFPSETIKDFSAMTQVLYIPREAMGFGDVKLLAAIGAFLGPMPLFFVIMFSSLVGSLVGIAIMVLGRKQWGIQIPYGPYLSFAAIVWLFYGPKFMALLFPALP
jgi:leader peptidase (prepilin peptidase) / N-methyltransferase